MDLTILRQQPASRRRGRTGDTDNDYLAGVHSSSSSHSQNVLLAQGFEVHNGDGQSDLCMHHLCDLALVTGIAHALGQVR